MSAHKTKSGISQPMGRSWWFWSWTLQIFKMETPDESRIPQGVITQKCCFVPKTVHQHFKISKKRAPELDTYKIKNGIFCNNCAFLKNWRLFWKTKFTLNANQIQRIGQCFVKTGTGCQPSEIQVATGHQKLTENRCCKVWKECVSIAISSQTQFNETLHPWMTSPVVRL